MKLVSLAVISIFSVIGSVMANGDEPSLRGASTSDTFEQQVAKATVHEQYCKKKDEACNARVRITCKQ
ncbi:hypothetical protein ACHAWO_007754 [Cyclotella atomus]|uniref:Uncharacterized protein n=1 Tax=Cyclotella atomus TaxID=382360 RepID=A0ABD3PJ64_9STRA